MTKDTKPGARKPRSRSNLTEEQRAWLVTAWATFKRAPDIVTEFEQTFGFKLATPNAHKYNCSGITSIEEAKHRGLAKWMDLHNKVRTEFEAAIKDIPIANATYRMQQLDKMFEDAMGKRNFRMAASLLEQAAKESGGAFSNKRVVEGNVEHKHEHDVPMDIKRTAIATKIRDLIADGLKAREAEQQAQALPASQMVIDG